MNLAPTRNTGIVPPWLTDPIVLPIMPPDWQEPKFLLPVLPEPRRDWHILPDGPLWQVKQEGAPWAAMHSLTKIEATGYGVTQARAGHVSLVIHGRDGKIQHVWSYDTANIPFRGAALLA